MNKRLCIQAVILLMAFGFLLLFPESSAFAVRTYGARRGAMHNLYTLLAGGFGTFLMVALAGCGAACLLMSGGRVERSNQLVLWGTVLLLIAAALVAIRMLVLTGTMDYIEMRSQYRR